jgi:hypothetical protein
MKCFRHAIAAVVIAVMAGVPGARALRAAELAVDPQREAQVKAAYIVNFIRYTEWPADDTSDAYVVTVLGRTSVAPALQRVAQRVQDTLGKPLRIERLTYPEGASDGSIDPMAYPRFYESLSRSHVLYIGAGETRRVDEVLKHVRPHVLTVSAIRGFAARGGMIELVLDEGHIVFEANAKALAAADLRMSAKALMLARRVHGEPQR